MSKDEFVDRWKEDTERKRLEKYQPYCMNPIIGYRTAAITKRMKREKRRYYR